MAETATSTAPATAPATAAKPKATLHWLNLSRAQRVVWLLEECKGLDWSIETYKRGSDMLAPAELKTIHPLGKSPVITIESAYTDKPVVLAETGALTEYLVDHFAPHLAPARYQQGKEGQVGGETESWNRYRYFMHYAEGSLMPLMVIALIMENIKTKAPFIVRPITRAVAAGVEAQFLNPNFETHFTFLETQLTSSPDGGQYLCGKDLTAADIILSFPLIAGREKIASKFKKLQAYIDLLESHPSYKASIATVEKVTGEPYMVANPR